MRKSESRRAARPFGPPGFTLVELLVVISVILLLAAILMPTIQVIIRQFYAGRSTVMVRRLHDGALLYKQTTKFLPGEKKDTTVPGGGATGDVRAAMNNGTLTGSQVLAACLFNIPYDEVRTVDFSKEDNAKRITAPYVAFDPKYLIKQANKTNSISDGFPQDRAMAICYFLASNNPSYVGKVSQFRITHNQVYMENLPSQTAARQQVLEDWITRRAQTIHQVFNNGEFVLLAPGLNRNYLVADIDNPDDPGQTMSGPDKDDISNDYGRRKP
jgi:prepilin-type N-terminal cleavage/methylation domain-containing protein